MICSQGGGLMRVGSQIQAVGKSQIVNSYVLELTREKAMRSRIIHLINPKTDSLITRPLYLNRALYSPLAGLLAVAACIPRDKYEVVLTDENIEDIDFGLKADLVGISAMTSYVNRGYQIADQFRAMGIPVVMGGVHPSFMPQEALKHCDAVVVGEVERLQWLVYNLFMRRGAKTERIDAVAPPTALPDVAPMPPILPVKREWRAAVLEAAHGAGPHLM